MTAGVKVLDDFGQRIVHNEMELLPKSRRELGNSESFDTKLVCMSKDRREKIIDLDWIYEIYFRLDVQNIF